jgi:hypothetical protein
METYLRTAGFQVEETIVRDPYPEVEHPSRRAYLTASDAPPSYRRPSPRPDRPRGPARRPPR